MPNVLSLFRNLFQPSKHARPAIGGHQSIPLASRPLSPHPRPIGVHLARRRHTGVPFHQGAALSDPPPSTIVSLPAATTSMQQGLHGLTLPNRQTVLRTAEEVAYHNQLESIFQERQRSALTDPNSPFAPSKNLWQATLPNGKEALLTLARLQQYAGSGKQTDRSMVQRRCSSAPELVQRPNEPSEQRTARRSVDVAPSSRCAAIPRYPSGEIVASRLPESAVSQQTVPSSLRQLASAEPGPIRRAQDRRDIALFSHPIQGENAVTPRLRAYGDILRYDDNRCYPIQLFSPRVVDMTALRERIEASHAVKEISGTDNNCWWRSAIVSAIVQRSPAELESALAKLEPFYQGLTFRQDVETLKAMAEAFQRDGLPAILTGMERSDGIAPLDEYSRLKLAGKSDAEDNGRGEEACKRLVAAILRHNAVDDKEIRKMVFGTGLGDFEHVMAVSRELGAEVIVHSLDHETTGEPQVFVCAQPNGSLNGLQTQSRSDEWPETFLRRMASLPVIRHQGTHFNVMIPKRLTMPGTRTG